MMARLLKLKKAIMEYFRRHPDNQRKLTSHEWLVTNEVCSLLDTIAEVTTRIQGSVDTHVSQTVFLMKEAKELLDGDAFPIRRSEADSAVPVPTENTPVEELSEEARRVREVLLEMMEKKELGTVDSKVERICMLLDPRRKECSSNECLNGCDRVKSWAEADVKEVGDSLSDPEVLESTPASPSSATTTSPGANGASEEPAAKRQRVMTPLERRRAERLAKAKGAAAASTAEKTYGRGQSVRKELATYLAEKVEPEEDDFSLLEFWLRKSSPTTCAETGEVLAAAAMPHLALIARLYHGIESTSCQAERNFSALSLLIGNLRTTMAPYKVERFMFIRLNQHLIPEIQKLAAVTNAQRARAIDCAKKTAEVQEAVAGTEMEILI
jgi:hypothetical protein